MKRRKLLKNKTASYIAASILTLALAGITCGTFAWFNYDTRTPVSELNGTAIGFGELECGVISNVDLPYFEQYGLIKDETNPDQIVYWVDGHYLRPETLNYILHSNGYATDTLYPASTLKYSKGSDFSLYSAPAPFNDGVGEATKDFYVHVSLVFKYKDLMEENETYLPGENIYLSKFKLNTLDENMFIHKAVRIFSDDKEGNTHLINPTSNQNGSTEVGGVLDLNGDGYYDCKTMANQDYERVYGQVKESSYKENPEDVDSYVAEEDKTTFVASHKSGTYALETCVPEVAQYEGFYEFRNRRKCVTTTNPDTNNYAYLDLSIFIEGWDLNVIDSQIGMQFSIELTFDTAL